MSVTAQRLFYGAYKDAGMVTFEQTGLSPDQLEDARQLCNRMFDAWNIDGLKIARLARTLFPITTGVGDYTIGPGGTWSTSLWPERIERASVIMADGQELVLSPMTVDEWQQWAYKAMTGTPAGFYYEHAFPLGIVHLVTVPSNAYQAALYLEEGIAEIESAGDYSAVTLYFRPGYQEAIETNLACRIAEANPERAKISTGTLRRAMTSLQLIKNANVRPLMRTSEMSSYRGGRPNIYIGR